MCALLGLCALSVLAFWFGVKFGPFFFDDGENDD